MDEKNTWLVSLQLIWIRGSAEATLLTPETAGLDSLLWSGVGGGRWKRLDDVQYLDVPFSRLNLCV